MASALTATFRPGSNIVPPSVLLEGTGLPTQTPPYVSAFSVGNVDGWTGSLGTDIHYVPGYVRYPPTTTVPSGVLATTAAEAQGTWSRTVTDLVVGQPYDFTLYASSQGGKIQLGVSGMTFPPAVVPVGRAALKYTFTATAASHVIQFKLTPLVTTADDYSTYRLDTMRVARAPSDIWYGTTIYRTDVNGERVVLDQKPSKQIATGPNGSGTYAITDYEHALVGPLTYELVDGDNTHVFASPHGVQTNLVLNPTVNSSTGGGTANWFPSGSGTSQGPTSTVASSGVTSLRVTTGTGTSSGTYALATGVVAGKTYGARIRCLPPVLSDLRITLQWLDASSVVISSVANTELAVPAGSGVWATLSVTGVAPPLATQARIYMQRVNSSVAGQVYYVDEALLVEVPDGSEFDPVDYWDGDYTGSFWTGLANASSSSRPAAPTSTIRPGTWVELPATAFPEKNFPPLATQVGMVTDLDETSETNGSIHTIVGRPDPLVNAGPLSYRSGTMEIFCKTYAEAQALRELLANGDVAMLRQGLGVGLDRYFVCTELTVRNEEHSKNQRWMATLEYQEVVAP